MRCSGDAATGGVRFARAEAANAARRLCVMRIACLRRGEPSARPALEGPKQ
jgi:hypothetical protein